jgi:glycosyltransferase involved in cell wall biosynthesis
LSIALLEQLPKPPIGRSGWPWTSGAGALPPHMRNGQAWPPLTVVTPSYNQGSFIEATIRSVLLQGYPRLEYIVLDGGSTDSSCEVIERYSPWLSRYRSEPDAGQASAIAEGWHNASGEIITYLNSDDVYLPDAFRYAVQHLSENGEAAGVSGAAVQIDEHDCHIGLHSGRSGKFDKLLTLEFLPQPAVFLRASAVEQAGGIDTSLKYAFDLDLWLRVAHAAPIEVVPNRFAATRLYPDTLTTQRRPETGAELELIARKLHRLGMLSWRQSARLRGSVAFVRTSIHMDDFPRSFPKAVLTALTGTLRHPPTGLRFVSAGYRRLARTSTEE